MSEANTIDVVDTVHNSSLIVDQYTPEDFLASSHRISDTITYNNRLGACADRLGRPKTYVKAAFVRLYQVKSLTTYAEQSWKNIFFCRISDPYGISYRLDWCLARIYSDVSGRTSNDLWPLYCKISMPVTDPIATVIESL